MIGREVENHSKALCELDETLSTYISKISVQKDEILKTEKLINHVENHLSKQNKILKTYFEEKAKIKEEILKIIKYDDDCREMYEKMNQIKLNDEDDCREIYEKMDQIKLKDEELPKQITEAYISTQFNNDRNIKQIQLKTIKNETILKLRLFENEIFIGGSHGLLLRHVRGKTYVFETNTTEDILQLVIMKHGERISLLAFTIDTLLIYENITDCTLHKDIKLPGIGVICNDASLIYIPVKNSLIMRMNKQNFEMEIIAILEREISSIITGVGENKATLVLFKNSLLCRATKTDTGFVNVELFEAIRKVKGILRVLSVNFLCYSDNNIWLLDSNLVILNNIELKEIIKLVDVNVKQVAFVDENNTLCVYEVSKLGFSNEKVFVKKIIGNVSALTIANEYVYLCIENDIIVIKYTL